MECVKNESWNVCFISKRFWNLRFEKDLSRECFFHKRKFARAENWLWREYIEKIIETWLSKRGQLEESLRRFKNEMEIVSSGS